MTILQRFNSHIYVQKVIIYGSMFRCPGLLLFGALTDSADMQGPAGGLLNFDDCPANTNGTRRDGKVPGQAIHEAFNNWLMIAAEAGIVWAAHPGVAKERRSSGEDALVGRLDMGMGSNDCGDFTVEESAHRDFLAGRFGVHIDDNDTGFLTQPLDLRHGCVKRIIQNGLHKRPTLNIDDSHLALCGLQDKTPLPRSAEGIVDWSEQARFAGNVGGRIALIPNMITCCDHGHAGAEEVDGNLACDSTASGGVLAIHDDKIDVALLEENGDESHHRVASGLADNVPQEENTNHLSFVSKFPGCTV